MTSRQRIGVGSGGGAGGGGGPAPTGNVLWGPDFGNPPEITMGASVSMPTVVIVNNKVIGVNVAMPALALVNDKAVGAHAEMPHIALVNDDHLGAQITMPAVALVNDKQLGVNVTMPAARIANTKGVGAHLSGTAGAPPQWESVETADTGTFGATSIDVNKPAGVQPGDLLLLCANSQGSSFSGTPTGFTAIGTEQSSGSSRTHAWYRIANGTEGATFTVSVTGTSGICVDCHRITNPHPTTPINVSAQGSANVTDPVIPSVTTTAARCLVFYVLGHFHGTGQAHATPANHVERSEHQSGDPLLKASLTTGTRIFNAAGSTGTVTIDCNTLGALDAGYKRIAIAPGTVTLAP